MTNTLAEAFANLSDTAGWYWEHGNGCPLRYNTNLSGCTCGVDAVSAALHAALEESEEVCERYAALAEAARATIRAFAGETVRLGPGSQGEALAALRAALKDDR